MNSSTAAFKIQKLDPTNPLRPEAYSASGRSGNLTREKRDAILFAILDSLVMYPDQSSSLRSEINSKIQKRFNVEASQIAGIRANLTRGLYGDLDLLVNMRKSQLKKLVKQANQKSKKHSLTLS